MDGLIESINLANALDITPVKARRYLTLREEYEKSSHGTVRLDPNRNPDARIIDAMGWGEGGKPEIKWPIPPSFAPSGEAPIVRTGI